MYYVYFRTLIQGIMKKLFTLFAIILGLGISLHAQKPEGLIKGKLVDSVGKQPVADATISLLNPKDSSLVTFTLTSKAGVFELKGLEPGD